MMYRLLILFLIFSACQRKIVPQTGIVIDVHIDTTLHLLSAKDIPANSLTDVHHLLRLGYEKSGTTYDSLQFLMYFDPKLKDSIRIQAPGSDTVYLTIGNKHNKSVALYSYLDLLGYRFYGPEDHWTYIPEIVNLSTLDTLMVAYFQYRSLSPSYGVRRHNIPRLDTTGRLFSRWTNRLRMANLVQIPADHYGSTFNRKYKAEIENHPAWRGIGADGKPRVWHINLKLCYSHPEVINLYKQDALERLKNLQDKIEPPYIMSMEPPDGDGFCKCEICKKSVSDPVYGLANAVALYIYEHDTNAMVSLYGYNQHAAAPSFSLADNVIVGIVPYAFQSIGSPEVMMNQWEATGAKLYLRDYLAIPVWSYDRPSYHPGGSFLNKINHIKDADYLGYAFETTASFMSVGLQFYLLSQASWTAVEDQVEFDLFLDRFFHGYQNQVAIIYENLPGLDNRTFASVVQSINSLIAESENNIDTIINRRLTDLKFYVEYLYLLNQFNSNPSDQNTELLLDKILSGPGIRLLHPYGMFRTLQRNKKFDRNFQWTENKAVTIPEREGFQLTLRRRSEPEFNALNPDFYLDSVTSFQSIPLRNTRGILYVGNNHDGIVKFRAMLKRLNSSVGGVVIIRDISGNHIKDVNLIPDSKWREYSVRLTPGQFYKIQFRTPGAEMQLQGPNRPFAFTEPLYNKYLYKQVPFYFRVPENQETVKIHIPQKSQDVVVNSGGDRLFTKKQFEPYTIDITQQQGRVVEVIMYRHGLQLLNIPHLLALHPDGVIFQSRQIE